jgi:Ca2+-binding RTX toxin-like protein
MAAPYERWLTIGYSPALGVRRTVHPAVAGRSEDVKVYDSAVSDVGDQDGDGVSDIAYFYVVRLSSSGETVAAVNPLGLGGALFLVDGHMIMGSVADRNGDGKRELITVVGRNYVPDPPSSVDWMLDIFLSATLPVPVEVDPPVDQGDVLEFGATFATAPGGGTRTLAARPSVELTGPDGKTKSVAAPDVIDASKPTTDTSVKVDPAAAGLVPGATYRYRVLLENGRGLVGSSKTRSFTFRPPKFHTVRGTSAADRLTGGSARDELLGYGGADVLRGGPAGDILRGGRGPDTLYGQHGPDLLIGGGGEDELHGGRGDDVFRARDGRVDAIHCGDGHDRVTADAGDRVGSSCESVDRG